MKRVLVVVTLSADRADRGLEIGDGPRGWRRYRMCFCDASQDHLLR